MKHPCPFCRHPLSRHGRGGGNGALAAPNCRACETAAPFPCPLRRTGIALLYRDPGRLDAIAANDGRWSRFRVERAREILDAARRTVA